MVSSCLVAVTSVASTPPFCTFSVAFLVLRAQQFLYLTFEPLQDHMQVQQTSATQEMVLCFKGSCLSTATLAAILGRYNIAVRG